MNIFSKLFQFSIKQTCFFHAVPTQVHDRRLHLLHPSVVLPASRRAQRVTDELVNDLNYFIFVNSIWK